MRGVCLVRGGVGGHQQHAVERELVERVAGESDMPEVRRVEGAAEDAERSRAGVAGAHARTCPSPSTRYLNVHSSRRPIGPRAWSFWVELPISAPMPNSPPSVNRVEALTYTQAASTPSWNARAAVASRVTIASECPLPWRLTCSIAS